MNLNELSHDQREELKCSLLEEVLGSEPSWDEYSRADEIVSDDILEQRYGSTVFYGDDFFCSMT
nr:MAG TPA: hypothetical protein [Caudoviricetes sp.]